MTLDEFKQLSGHAQEDFLNSGGVIDSTTGEAFVRSTVCNPLPSVVENSDVDRDTNISHPEEVTAVSSSENQPETSDASTNTQSQVKQEAASSSAQVDTLPPVDNVYSGGFDIDDPIELLFLVDDEIINGKIVLDDWQLQFMLDFAHKMHNSDHPFQAALQGANGIGKDKYAIAACAVWVCMKYPFTVCPTSSASGFQLDEQTCKHIKTLANQVNSKWGKNVSGFDIWKCNYRHFLCLVTNSYIPCFATDEPGKAEGFHPLKAESKLCIFMSEDKSIPDEINVAVNKYTGYTHRIHASTPGPTRGHFYDICTNAIDRESLKDVKEAPPGEYIRYFVPASKCRHFKQFYIEQMKRDLPGGEHGPAFKSQVHALFGDESSMVVVAYNYVWKSREGHTKTEWIQEPYNTAGLDLSDGGDETVLVVRNGNRMLKLIPFKFDQPDDTIKFLEEKFEENKLKHPNALIFGDFGGIGAIILKRLKRLGWSNIRFRDNRHKSSQPHIYLNWNAESWFNLGNLIKRSEIILLDDPIFVKQVSSRMYKLRDGVIHQMVSKIETRNQKHPSPDRADATVLAFSNYKSTYVEIPEDKEKPFEVDEEKQEVVSTFTLKGSVKKQDEKLSRYNFNRVSSISDELKEDMQEQINKYNQQVLTN